MLPESEEYNKKLEKINKELSEKVRNLKEEKEKLIKEKNDINNNKMRELEEELESLKIKNNNYLSDLKEEREKNEELLLLIKNKDGNENINNIKKFEEMKKMCEDALKDCENYKMINEKLMKDNNEKQKIIDENEKLYSNNEKENLNKEIENLKNIINEKDSDNKELIEKNIKLESELKKFKRKEKNPFSIESPLSEEFRTKNIDEGRHSLGAKDAKAEKYKKMVMDYENQIGNDQSQLNMLKSDIKNLRSKLKEKDIKEIKLLIESGYKGYNPSNKAQKEAVKKLHEYLEKQ